MKKWRELHCKTGICASLFALLASIADEVMASLSERIAEAALRQFERLPMKCKPRVHPDGRREWTPLSAIVAVSGKCSVGRPKDGRDF